MPDFRKKGMESGWSVTDREGIAITMAMGNAPQAVAMELQKEYAERYDWIVKEFTAYYDLLISTKGISDGGNSGRDSRGADCGAGEAGGF